MPVMNASDKMDASESDRQWWRMISGLDASQLHAAVRIASFCTSVKEPARPCTCSTPALRWTKPFSRTFRKPHISTAMNAIPHSTPPR